ncbi:MAG: DHH family phosphoesterase [Solirubrobacteraceae bacterium]
MSSLERTSSQVQSGRDAALAALKAASKTIVVTHENPDGDALGSLVGMHYVLRALGQDCLMFVAAEDLPLPYEYRFLEMDELVSQPPGDVDERTIVFLDCGNVDRNPGAMALRSRDGWERVVNIDHHHDNTLFGTTNYVDADASCTAEIVWDLAAGLGVELSRVCAEALYVGLITDTGCFMYANTGPRAHQMAAELIDLGIDAHAIYQQVYEDVPFAKLALLAQGLANAERYDDGRLIATQLQVEDFAATGAQPSYTEGVVDHLRAVRGVLVAALVRDRLTGDGEPAVAADGARQRKVSLRASDGRIDVSAIARMQGGGGHRAAAGFSTSLPWNDLIEFLRTELGAQLANLSAEL